MQHARPAIPACQIAKKDGQPCSRGAEWLITTCEGTSLVACSQHARARGYGDTVQPLAVPRYA